MVLGIYFTFALALCVGECVGAFTHPHRQDDFAEKVALVVIVAILGWFLLRLLRAGTLKASPSGIVVRDVLRTRQYDWNDLARFEEMVLPIGASQVPRRFLRVHLTAGGFKNLTVLNDSRRRNPDIVAELVQRLGDMRESAEVQPHRRLPTEK